MEFTPQQALDSIIPLLWSGFVLSIAALVLENKKQIAEYLNFVPVQIPKDDDDGDPPTLR